MVQLRKAAKMAKKTKLEKVDGLGPDNIKKLRTAIRQVWSWSHARRLVVARCLRPDGFSNCEKCKKMVAKIYPDHITPCGDLDEGYIKRMFVPSTQMQGLCNVCHNAKTKMERQVSKKKTTVPKRVTRKRGKWDDYY